MLNTIEEVLAELRAGRPVLVTDDADRENEGTPSWPQNSLIRAGSAGWCATLPATCVHP